MRKIVCFAMLISLIFSGTSCKDALELQPLDQFSDQNVWNGEDAALIQGFVNNIYRGIGHGHKQHKFASFVDEAMVVWDHGTSNLNMSNISPSDYSAFGLGYSSSYLWENAYLNIRACNVFFEKIESATAVDDAQKNRFRGEVHFLRAYLYSMLVSVYGGVPIIDKAYKLNDTYEIERNSFEECINFIVSECDKAAGLIVPADKGHASKGAALALKSRVLLYAARDLFNNEGAWATGYANKELIGYVGGSRAARWKAAKDAAKAVIDLGIYNLHKTDSNIDEDLAKTYGEIFLLKETSEDIFVRYFIQRLDGDGANPGLFNSPNGYHCWGGNTPIGQIVDDYPMRDGSRFSWTNPLHAAKPYTNRDPRFYASILYDGASWRARTADVKGLDPVGIIQTGNYEKWNAQSSSVTVVPGVDTRKSPIEDWNGTYSGYYLKKGIDPAYDAQVFRQESPWRFMRYTEILLNYAEACIGLGEEAEAKKYINMIRDRVGMPAVTATGTALVEAYRWERRIELAFEEHRFFDVRQWMIADQAYKDAKGVDILHKLNADKVTTTPVYATIASVQKRQWNPKFYFVPIRMNEMNRNKALIQNPLYE